MIILRSPLTWSLVLAVACLPAPLLALNGDLKFIEKKYTVTDFEGTSPPKNMLEECHSELGPQYRPFDFEADFRADYGIREFEAFMISENITMAPTVNFHDLNFMTSNYKQETPVGENYPGVYFFAWVGHDSTFYHLNPEQFRGNTTRGTRQTSYGGGEGRLLCIIPHSYPPTIAPTDAPTDPPTKAPTDAPADPPTKAPTKTTISTRGGVKGDPHFELWNGAKYDFHGACDLVFLHNPLFAKGLGMTIQIRTKITTWWSSIETTVLRIGVERLQVMGGEDGGRYWVNGEAGNELNDGDDFYISGFSVHFRKVNSKQKLFRIDLGNGDAIAIQTFKGFVSVNVHATSDHFQESVGLMGSYPEGIKLARDGSVLTDANTFGKEWQVLVSEPRLFRTAEGPQHPQECVMPDKSTTALKKRRLGQAAITEDDARMACAHVGPEDFGACIFDVLATNDKEMAGAY